MSHPLSNLRIIRDELRKRGWVATCFQFRYRRHPYFVFVERYLDHEAKPKYALTKIIFADHDDLDRVLKTWANSSGVQCRTQELRDYFRIEWVENAKDLWAQFNTHLGRYVPNHAPLTFHPDERRFLLRRLSVGDSDNPERVYCTHVRRNPDRADGTPGRRSVFNSQKTEILRPTLYRHLRNETNLSFCYSVNPEDHQDDATIISQWATRQTR